MANLHVEFTGQGAVDGLQRLARESQNADSRVRGLQDSLDRTSQSATRSTTSINSLVTAFVGLNTVKNIISSLTKAFTELELAEANVIKTTGFSKLQMDKLSESLKDLAKNASSATQGFNIDELYSIAEQAGQLGIKSQKDILSFTTEIQKLVLTSTLSAEDASKGVAKLANSMKVPIKDVRKLTSVMTALASATTANEQEILNYSQRLAGTGKTLGLTTAEIAGLGATMNDVGMTAEVAGTAMSKVMQNMMSKTGDMADAVGLKYKEFSELVMNKPVVALQVFIKRLGTLDKVARIEALEDMKMSGSGLSSTLLKLAENTNKLSKNLVIARKGFNEATATEKEFLAISNTLHAKQITLNSSFKILKATLFEQVAPSYKGLIDLTTSLTNYTTEHVDVLFKTGKVVGSVAIAWKLFNIALSASPIGRVTIALGLLVTGAVKAYKAIRRVINARKTSTERTEAYIQKLKSAEYQEQKRVKNYRKILAEEKRYSRSVDLTQKILKGQVKTGEKNKKLTKEQKEAIQKNLNIQKKQLSNLKVQLREYKKIYKVAKDISKIKQNTSSLPNIDSTPLPMDKKSKKARALEREAQAYRAEIAKDRIKDQKLIQKTNVELKKQSNILSKSVKNKRFKISKVTVKKVELPKFNKVKLDIEIPRNIKDSLVSTYQNIEEDIKRNTLKRFEFEKYQIQKQAEEYRKLGVEVSAISKWKDVKLSIIDFNQEKKKIDKLNSYLDKLKPTIEDFNERFSQIGLSDYEKKLKLLNATFEKYREAGIEESKLQTLYIDEISKLSKEQVKNEASKANEVSKQLKLEREKTTESQKNIKELVGILDSMVESMAKTALDTFAQTGDLDKAFDSATSNTRGALMNSGNPYAQGLAVVSSIISGTKTKIIELDTNIHKDNQSIIKSFSFLNSLENQQLQFTKQIAENTRNLFSETGKLAMSLSSGKFTEDLLKFVGEYKDRLESHQISSSNTLGFASRKNELRDYGISFVNQSLGDFLDAVEAQSYTLARSKTSSAWGLISYTKDSYNELNNVSNEFKEMLQDAVSMGIGGVMKQSEALGVATEQQMIDIFSSLQIDLGKLSLMNKNPQEIQEALNGAIGEILDTATSSVAQNLLDTFQQVDESAYETLTRVSNSFLQAQNALESTGVSYILHLEDLQNKQGDIYTETIRTSILNVETTLNKLDKAFSNLDTSRMDLTISDIGYIIQDFKGTGNELLSLYQTLEIAQSQLRTIQQNTVQLSQQLYDAYSGQMQQLVNDQQNFYDSFASTDTKQSDRLSELNQVFGEFGDKVPKTSQAMYELAQAIDTTTKEGAEQYQVYMQVADTFKTYTQEVERQSEERRQELEQQRSDQESYYQSQREAQERMLEKQKEAKEKELAELKKIEDEKKREHEKEMARLKEMREKQQEFYKESIKSIQDMIEEIRGKKDISKQQSLIQSLISYNTSIDKLQSAMKSNTFNEEELGSSRDALLDSIKGVLDNDVGNSIKDSLIGALEAVQSDFKSRTIYDSESKSTTSFFPTLETESIYKDKILSDKNITEVQSLKNELVELNRVSKIIAQELRTLRTTYEDEILQDKGVIA